MARDVNNFVKLNGGRNFCSGAAGKSPAESGMRVNELCFSFDRPQWTLPLAHVWTVKGDPWHPADSRSHGASVSIACVRSMGN